MLAQSDPFKWFEKKPKKDYNVENISTKDMLETSLISTFKEA